MRRNVAILVFDDVEVLDFAGPFEVFAVADELSGHTLFHTFTAAPTPGTIRARNGLKIVPEHTLESAPTPQVVIVPGGAGTRPLLRQPALLEWLRQRARAAEVVASVCTGALVLGQAGLLDGLTATTHYQNLDELRAVAPRAQVVAEPRFVDHGRIATAAGISAGIDLALHLVGRLTVDATAQRTADYMEYRRRNDNGATR